MSSSNGDRVPQDRGNYGSSSSEWAVDRRENHRWREESDKNVDGIDAHGGEVDHSGSGGGSFSMRPIFLGNVSYEATPADVQDIFTNPFAPYSPEGSGIDPNAPIYVDHVVRSFFFSLFQLFFFFPSSSNLMNDVLYYLWILHYRT
jgi:hypothetical protein